MRKLIAKYAGVCKAPGCGAAVTEGTLCWYEPTYGVFHENCAPNGLVPSGSEPRKPRYSPRPRYNSASYGSYYKAGPRYNDKLTAADAGPAQPEADKKRCLRCKRVIGYGPGEARPWNNEVKVHCYDCWLDNEKANGSVPAGPTASLKASQKKADASLAVATATIAEAGKVAPSALPKSADYLESAANRFALIELD